MRKGKRTAKLQGGGASFASAVHTNFDFLVQEFGFQSVGEELAFPERHVDYVKKEVAVVPTQFAGEGFQLLIMAIGSSGKPNWGSVKRLQDLPRCCLLARGDKLNGSEIADSSLFGKIVESVQLLRSHFPDVLAGSIQSLDVASVDDLPH